MTGEMPKAPSGTSAAEAPNPAPNVPCHVFLVPAGVRKDPVAADPSPTRHPQLGWLRNIGRFLRTMLTSKRRVRHPQPRKPQGRARRSRIRRGGSAWAHF